MRKQGRVRLSLDRLPISENGDGLDFAFDLVAMDPARNQMTLRMFIKPEGKVLQRDGCVICASIPDHRPKPGNGSGGT